MKKPFLAALCSALVIPGLGQVLNRDLKKGLFILGGCFVLFVASVIKLYFIVRRVLEAGGGIPEDAGILLGRLKGEDLSALWILLGLFGILWVYAVADAYLSAMKSENQDRKEGT